MDADLTYILAAFVLFATILLVLAKWTEADERRRDARVAQAIGRARR